MTSPDPQPLKAQYDQIYPGGPEDRRRNLMWAAGIAGIVALAFALVSAIYITTVVQRNVKRDALHAGNVNCQNIATGRVAGNQFRFAIREELAFIPDLIAASQKKGLDRAARVFFDAEIKRLNLDLALERARGTPGLPTHLAGFQDLFPLLADQPLVTCSATK